MINNIADISLLAKNILIRPFTDPSMLWIVLPLILILVLIDLYFGRHRSEELGWNSAFSNTISLLWICIIIFRFLFEKHGFGISTGPEAVKEFIIAGILAFWVLSLLAFNFFHVLPKRFAFAISSWKSVYVAAFIVISVIRGGFPLDLTTLLASVILLASMLLFLKAVMYIIPMSRTAKQSVKRKEDKKKRSDAGKKAAKTKKAKTLKKVIKKKIKKIKNKL